MRIYAGFSDNADLRLRNLVGLPEPMLSLKKQQTGHSFLTLGELSHYPHNVVKLPFCNYLSQETVPVVGLHGSRQICRLTVDYITRCLP